MSANANSVRFKFTCNVHDWAYFEKNPEKHNFYIKSWAGHFLYQYFSNDAKEADILNRCGSP